MARLYYSAKAFGRALQMSSVAAFVFAEGELDKAFLDRLVTQRPEWSGMKVLVRLAREIDPSLGEGKVALLQLHLRLKRRKQLSSVDKKRIVMFLDKDIDDLTRTKRRCRHIVYTDYYNIENYIYRFTALQLAAADAALMPVAELDFLDDQGAWATDVAKSWAEWVAFGLAVRLNGAAHLPNFGCESLIHDKKTAGLDPQKYQTLISSFAKAKAMSSADTSKLCDTQKQRFTKMVARGEHDRVWNGKWYGSILCRQLRQQKKVALTANEAFSERLLASAFSRLDFRGPWATCVSSRLRAAILDETIMG